MATSTAEMLYPLVSVLVIFMIHSGSCSSVDMICGNMNTDFHPCKNFYNYACGNFGKRHPRPPYKRSISYFDLRADEVRSKVLYFFKHADLRAYPNIRKMYSMYEQCVNEKPYDNMKVLKRHLQMVGLPAMPPFHAQVPPSFDASTTLARIHRYSPMTLFLFKVRVNLDPQDMKYNHIYFGHAPSASKAPISTTAKVKSEFEPTKEEIHEALVKYLSTVADLVYSDFKVQLTPKQKSRKDTIVKKVAEFLLELDKAVNIDRLDAFDNLSYIFYPNFQTWTDKIQKSGKIQINWNKYFEVLFEKIAKPSDNLTYTNWTNIMIQSPEQIQHILRVLQNTSREVFVCAMWFTVVHSMTHFTPSDLQDAKDEYVRTVLKTPTQPRATMREDECAEFFMDNVNSVVGYVLAHYDNGFRKRDSVAWMVKIIKQCLHDMIQETPWLDEKSKAEAIKKLNNITSSVALSNSQLNIQAIENSYADETVESNFYLTLHKISQNERTRNLAFMLMQNEYKSRATITGDASAVVASYYPQYLHLAISSGFIGFPFFDLGLSVLNYAAMGSQIGHELGHPYDRTGIKYNAKGEYKSWLSSQSRKEYQKQEKCFQLSYGKFFFTDIEKSVNGDTTLSENIADNIGFAAALKAYRYAKKYYGPEPIPQGLATFTHEQLFTLGFANIWCENASPQYLTEMIKSDMHSPRMARVNGVMMNSRDFADIWNCPKGTPMNPKTKCEIFS